MYLIDTQFINMVMKKQKMSHGELAAKMYMTPDRLIKILTDDASPITIKQAFDLAYHLKCWPSQLFVDPERVICTCR